MKRGFHIDGRHRAGVEVRGSSAQAKTYADHTARIIRHRLADLIDDIVRGEGVSVVVVDRCSGRGGM